MPKVICISQARMGSSRLPGKVLAMINGKPMLEYHVSRVHESTLIDHHIIATTDSGRDHPIVDFCIENNHLFFYYSNLNLLDKKLVSFFVYHIYKNNHSFVFNTWKHGLLSNFNMQALDILFDLFPEKKKTNYNFNFTSLLFRLIFFSFKTKEIGIDWFKHLKLIKKYWRFFTFYCFFKNLNVVPDVSIIINSNKMITPIKECNSLKIPVVGLVDTDTNIKYFTYPIPSNDNSFLISSFFFLLFML